MGEEGTRIKMNNKTARIEKDKVTRTMFIDFKETSNKVETFEGPLNGQILIRVDTVEGEIVGITILKYRKTLFKVFTTLFGALVIFKTASIFDSFRKWFIDLPKEKRVVTQH